MDVTSPALQQLIAALDSLPKSPDLLALARVLEQSQLDDSDVREWVHETDASYHRATVVRRDGYELLVITWKKGQGSPPHDHSGSVSAMKVISGRAVEETYIVGADGYASAVSESSLEPGALTAWHDAGVHAIRNAGEETLITLNVYSPPLSDFRRFAVPVAPVVRHSVPNPQRKVLIVGGGFSGTMVAAQLLRQSEAARRGLQIVLAERRGVLGEGVAYGTPDEAHLLNVPAGRMSAWPDRPNDFVEWVCQNIRPADGSEFLPRKWYGRYIRESFLNLCRTSEYSRCETVLDEVRRISRRPDGGWIAHFARGGSILADDVILAIGHRSPSDPLASCWNGPRTRYVSDPWRPFACSAVGNTTPVVVLGSGLTAVDALLSLSTASRTSPIYLVSRHGLLPRIHQRPAPVAQDMASVISECLQSPSGVSIRHLVANVRKAIEQGRLNHIDWRAFIDGLRPHTAALWQSASDRERARFLRHVRPIWEVLRHRMAPEIGSLVQQWQETGAVRLLSGRIESVIATGQGARVYVRERGSDHITPIDAAWVINCTGPGPSNRAESNPAIGSLLLHGWVSPDSLGLGLRTTDSGLSVSADGSEISNLHIVGTLRKPASWESTAVPELRKQAEMAATQVVQASQQETHMILPVKSAKRRAA